MPGAAEEVREIAGLDPEAIALIGERATKDAVLAAMARADVIHYAGHGVASLRDPWATFLPLARPAGRGTGFLLAREIHGLAIGPWRVVTLSACGAPSDGELRSAGFPAMVSAFLAAGAETVVASLWSVDDQAVRPLVVEFHRALAEGLPAPEALDRARRRFIASRQDASPHLWASLGATSSAFH